MGPGRPPWRSYGMMVHQPQPRFSTQGLQAWDLPCDAGTVLCVAPFLLPACTPQIASAIPVPCCSHLQHHCIPATGSSHCGSHQETWAGGGCLGIAPRGHIPAPADGAQAGRGMQSWNQQPSAPQHSPALQHQHGEHRDWGQAGNTAPVPHQSAAIARTSSGAPNPQISKFLAAEARAWLRTAGPP